MNIAIIFAGGSGVRMGAGLPKQFLQINGKPILIHTLENFQNHMDIDKIYIACKEDYIRQTEKYVQKFQIDKVQGIVPGGSSALESAYHALLKAREENPEDSVVLIHDGVRPFLTDQVICDDIASVKKYGSGITCNACYETVVISKTGQEIQEVPERKDAYTAQAPQCFYLGDIIKAYETTMKTNPEFDGIVDSCNLMRSLGKDVYIVEGNRGNIKVTTPEDFYVLRALLQYKENEQILGL